MCLTPDLTSHSLPTRMLDAPPLRRLFLLLALLPQIFLLGLGSGIVVCVAPGGHARLEIALSECRAVSSSVMRGLEPEVSENGSSENEPDSGSCSDLSVVLGFRASRSLDALISEFSSALTAHLVELPEFSRATDWSLSLIGHRVRDHGPPHLIHLRSIVLRC